MAKDLWINLPVKDIKKSMDFFNSIGFSFKDGTTKEMAAMEIGEKKAVVMLVDEKRFERFSQHKVTDTESSSEVLLSFDAGSRDEVDELAKKVEEAGGTVFSKPAENQGWMYGCAFTDLDRHRWNVLYMDQSTMPSNK